MCLQTKLFKYSTVTELQMSVHILIIHMSQMIQDFKEWFKYSF